MRTLIELTGPRRTGKTQLAQELACRNYWTFVEENSFPRESRYSPNNPNEALLYLSNFLSYQFDQLKHYSGQSEDITVITDFSLRDLQIYALLNLEDNQQREKYLEDVDKNHLRLKWELFDQVERFYTRPRDFNMDIQKYQGLEHQLFEEREPFGESIVLPSSFRDKISWIESYVRSRKTNSSKEIPLPTSIKF